ncbi:FTR1 family protein [Afifella sp. IM 167]|uniref:FTR1 family iron permease n=1 Tax=Afifella sp. IM 167 TaxID=2033586 RepID=UPI001CCDFCA6|nr:FTR1 family protein [Afifella sp. IM 167]
MRAAHLGAAPLGSGKSRTSPPFRLFLAAALSLCLLALSAPFFSVSADSLDYRRLADEVESRLARAAEAYSAGDAETAKDLVQGAYFEIFENLEGPIRVNVSAAKSYELEAEFGDIRKAMIDGAPAEAIKARIDAQIAAIEEVVPVLEEGFQIKAEPSAAAAPDTGSTAAANAATASSAPAAAPKSIEPYWQDALAEIETKMSDAAGAYEAGRAEEASRLVLDAQFSGYKNSLMETAVRRQLSASQDSAINAEFARINRLIADGKPARMVRASGDVLVSEIEDLLPGLPLPEGAKARADAAEKTTSDWSATADKVDTELTAAIDLYRDGDTAGAIRHVQNTYFDVFEASGMEAAVGARDTTMKTTLEGHFTRLAGAMKQGADASALEDELSATRADLAAAVARLGGGTGDSPTTLFIYALTIILREGFEAMLVVTAMLTYLERIGHGEKRRVIYNSVLVALVASVATAVLLDWVFEVTPARREVLEGATMLAAAVILFTMSYWLISKAEAQKWMAYIKGKVGGSLSTGSLTALWLAGFLAVYREGAETVLFYKALSVEADTAGGTGIAAGFALGAALLVVVYLVMRYGAMRLPIRPFFFGTGALLYYLAFVFSGKGVMELIEGKVISPTLLTGMPEIPLLGIFPYVETLAPQLVLILAALAAIPIARRSGRPAHAA